MPEPTRIRRSRRRRSEPIVSETTSADAFVVETADPGGLERFAAAWDDLSARAVEPNAFADRAFLAPALARLAPGRVTILFVWSDSAREKLVGVAAIAFPRLPFGFARFWFSEQAGLPALALDRDAAAPALGAIVAWLRREKRRLSGLALEAVDPEGPVAAAAGELAARQSLPLAKSNPRRRAALPVGPDCDFEAGLDERRRHRLARQRRRLAELGQLEASGLEGASGIEAFLALERRERKRADDPAGAAFAREMLAGFAARGALRVHSLALDGAPIAIGVALVSGNRGFYWKTAYDQRFAKYAPNAQLTLDLSRRLQGEPGLTLIDSCAPPGCPMVESLWRGRINLVDLALAIRPDSERAFAAALAVDSARLSLRELAERALAPWPRRLRF
jgi:CelD/BcsL family acetyltransferase involved in cellulose biosynthesis